MTQSVTFRLWDSVPEAVLTRIADGLRALKRGDEAEAARKEHYLIEKTLDRGFGSRLLERPDTARIVEEAMLYFDGQRYHLHAWCVMPNHVHVMFTPDAETSLSDIVHSWKSYTTHAINRVAGRQGPLWQEDYYDRFIRDEQHYRNSLNYIERNPVKAKLCDNPCAWRYSSARVRAETEESDALGAMMEATTFLK